MEMKNKIYKEGGLPNIKYAAGEVPKRNMQMGKVKKNM